MSAIVIDDGVSCADIDAYVVELLAVYGPSISTASPENWARHRKVLAAPFMNESIMRAVWNESQRQTRQMMHDWLTHGVGSVSADTRALSLNVLAAIGFQRPFEFKASKSARNNGKKTANNTYIELSDRLSYRDALQIVLDNIILILMIPRKHLQYPILPAWMRRIGKASNDFYSHMQELLSEEIATATENSERKPSASLITSFERALDAHRSDRTKGMSEDEIMGNLFVINFAGHDTTANTLAFVMLLLVAHPEIQQWVSEEVSAVIGDLNQQEQGYGALFPRLIRCRAVMVSK